MTSNKKRVSGRKYRQTKSIPLATTCVYCLEKIRGDNVKVVGRGANVKTKKLLVTLLLTKLVIPSLQSIFTFKMNKF